MCSSNSKLMQPGGANNVHSSVNSPTTATALSDVNGRPVLQPATSNRVLERRNSLKKPSSPVVPTSCTPPISPKLKSPRQPAVKRVNIHDPSGGALMNSSSDKVSIFLAAVPKTSMWTSSSSSSSTGSARSPPPAAITTTAISPVKRWKKCTATVLQAAEAAGSIAAARREQVAVMQVQRKMKIAHYGRTKTTSSTDNSMINNIAAPNTNTSSINNNVIVREDKEKRCSFITPNSDPIYVAYHDEEWGVPAHDDKLLFELLVLTGAQVGSDWTSVLKKRHEFREAFSGFDAEVVSTYTEKKITSICSDYGIEVSLVRGVIDNSKCILEIKKGFGTLDKYVWGFVNHKPIETRYKWSQKIPVKTSKSEAISKDMVRRGFRHVGPTVIHSWMQAAGLTNDHLTTCPRHHHISSDR